MRISRGLWALTLIAILSPSLASATAVDKILPLEKSVLSEYSGEQLFKAAYQAYVCSFLMHLSGQIPKAQHLRSHSVRLMEEDSVTAFGKNWNDVNFPGALTAWGLADKYMKRFGITQKAAASRLLVDGPQCKILNELVDSEMAGPDLQTNTGPIVGAGEFVEWPEGAWGSGRRDLSGVII